MTKKKVDDQFDGQDEGAQASNEATYSFTIGADRTPIDGTVYAKGDVVELTALNAARLRRGGIKLDCGAETEAVVQTAHDTLFPPSTA